MRVILYMLFVALLLTSCKSAQSTNTSSSIQGAAAEQDGSSPEHAVKVNSVREEYEWAKPRCPGCQFMGQALLVVKKKPYDELRFKTPDGSEKKIYFDISSFFGKF